MKPTVFCCLVLLAIFLPSSAERNVGPLPQSRLQPSDPPGASSFNCHINNTVMERELKRMESYMKRVDTHLQERLKESHIELKEQLEDKVTQGLRERYSSDVLDQKQQMLALQTQLQSTKTDLNSTQETVLSLSKEVKLLTELSYGGFWIKKACITSSDCTEPMAACYSGQCLCDGGFFFDYFVNACVSRCTRSLGDTYVQYKDMTLYGHASDNGPANGDGAICQPRCTADPMCTGFTYYSNVDRCDYKRSTAQDYPNDWKPWSNKHFYQRTCQ